MMRNPRSDTDADGHTRGISNTRVANTEIDELKIHTRVDQVKMMWRVMALGARSPMTLARSPERRDEVRWRKSANAK